MYSNQSSNCVMRWLCAGAVAAAFAIMGQATQAQSFTYNISTSEALLELPDDMVVQKIEMWDSPLMRIIKRSRPFIEVKNTSAEGSGQNLTMFTMTIGDTDYSFGDSVLGDYAVTGYSTPGVIASTSAPGGDELAISFAGDGLAPGEVARFQIDLDPDPGLDLYVHPDFRFVLFDMNGGDDSDNSQLSGVFSTSGLGTQSIIDTVIPDPIAALVATEGSIRSYDTQEPVDMFGGEALIPEPSSLLLAVLAACSSAFGYRRR